MPKDGKPTRDKILKHSKDLVLDRGFNGTSIDMILERTGISKGTFLYHFRSKNDLARALMDEYIVHDDQDRKKALLATSKIDDPLERFLAFIQVFIDDMEKLTEPYSGCLYASYTYEPGQFDTEIRQKIVEAFIEWEHTIGGMLDLIYAKYKPQMEVDKKTLATLFSTVFEGALIVSKATNDALLTASHLKHFKNYIELLFRKTGHPSHT